MKICKTCQKELPETSFYFYKRNNYYLSNCKKCNYIKNKQWKLKNPEKVKIHKKKHRLIYSQEIKKYNKQYYKNNTEKLKNKIKQWKLKNPEKLQKQKNRNRLKRYTNNLNFKIMSIIRARIYQLLKGISKSRSTLQIIGSTLEEYKQHVEKQFKPGWSWKNQGKMWELDHIISCMFFDPNDPIELQQCFHYSNVQPLSIEDHKEKTKKDIKLFKKRFNN